jgi:hypothetical protein
MKGENMKSTRQLPLKFTMLGLVLLTTCNAWAGSSESNHSNKGKPIGKPKVTVVVPIDAVTLTYPVNTTIGAYGGAPTAIVPTTVTRVSSSSSSTTYAFGGSLNTTATLAQDQYDPTLSVGITSNGTPIAVFNHARGGTVSGTITDPMPGLSYADFGWWNTSSTTAGGVTTDTIGYFGSGPMLNLTAAMPKAGTASYSGTFLGDAFDGASRYQLVGALGLTANFATASVNGQINNIAAYDRVLPTPTTTFNDINLAGKITGNGFAGTATASSTSGTSGAPSNSTALAAGTSGTFNGHFYGPAANEVTGILQINSGTTTVVGSFGAKK